MAGFYAVCCCGSVDCPGWCGPEDDEIDPETERLEIEARAEDARDEARDEAEYDGDLAIVICDPRDATPEPPAYLDLYSVLRMRAMVKDAAENGDKPWPYLGAA